MRLFAANVVFAPQYASQGLWADVTDRFQALDVKGEVAPAHVRAGTWEDRNYAVPHTIDMGVAPIPGIDGGESTFVGGDAIGIGATSENADAAWDPQSPWLETVRGALFGDAGSALTEGNTESLQQGS